MPHTKSQRVTQRTIAELAGVSQATVSLVLNGKADTTSRIPEATRRRVLEAIAETTYVADPAARSLAGVGNNLVGIFTYEQAFPNETSDSAGTRACSAACWRQSSCCCRSPVPARLPGARFRT